MVLHALLYWYSVVCEIFLDEPIPEVYWGAKALYKLSSSATKLTQKTDFTKTKNRKDEFHKDEKHGFCILVGGIGSKEAILKFIGDAKAFYKLSSKATKLT